MNIDDRNIIWLDLFGFLTYHKKKKILSCFDKGVDIKKVFKSKPELRTILTDMEYNKMSNLLDDNFLDAQIEKFTQDGIIMITINDSRYPFLLREIDEPPLCLYCKGNVQLLNSLCFAVVGTRKPTDYGAVVTKQYVKELSKDDITIVSGLAQGIDTIAHRTALEQNGKTIAVLAGGLYHIYPASNYHLAREMTQNNLILSENSPNVTPMAYSFPFRNRIIAGLSRGVLIPEATLNSGSLHTKNYALDYNRDVFVVPGKITSPASSGTNALIKEVPIAMTTTPDDILVSLNIDKKNEKTSAIQLDMTEQIILNYIRTEKKTFQEIVDHTILSASELNTILFILELSGLVLHTSNNSYIMA